MNTTRIFLDTEFTGLHQKTTLISLALYKDDDTYLYAEFNDYDRSQISPWVEEHVMQLLEFQDSNEYESRDGQRWKVKGDRIFVKHIIHEWISVFPNVEIWADVLAYDWVLFCELFGGAFGIPENIFYAPFDLATLFRAKGLIIPEGKYGGDISRFDFAGYGDKSQQHNALADARAEKICYEKIMRI